MRARALPVGDNAPKYVLDADYYFRCVSMDLIASIDYSSPVWVDPEYSTFLRMELQLPGCFPSLQR